MTREQGQATVESALLAPLVAAVLLLIGQLLLVGRDQLRLELLAATTVRAAVVADLPEVTAREVVADLDPTVTLGTHRRQVAGVELMTVDLRRPVDGRIPLIGLVAGRLSQRAAATMVVEPPWPPSAADRVP